MKERYNHIDREPMIMEIAGMQRIEIKYRINVKVICPLKETDGLLADGDVAVRGEEELEQVLLRGPRI